MKFKTQLHKMDSHCSALIFFVFMQFSNNNRLVEYRATKKLKSRKFGRRK